MNHTRVAGREDLVVEGRSGTGQGPNAGGAPDTRMATPVLVCQLTVESDERYAGRSPEQSLGRHDNQIIRPYWAGIVIQMTYRS